MKISIAMATYNGAKYLHDQLESLAKQTKLPYELVICDDGSTDGTLKLLHKFAAQSPFPVRIYQNDRKLGYGDNFIKAATLCNGDWIAFCDQDDVWLPSKLEICSGHFKDNVTMLYHSAKVVDADLHTIGGIRFQEKEERCYPKGAFPPWKSIAGFTIIFNARLPLFSKSDPRPRDPHRPDKLVAHDQWVPFLATTFGKVVFVPFKLALYRQHGGNTVGVSEPQTFVSLSRDDCSKHFSKELIFLANLSNERASYLAAQAELYHSEVGNQLMAASLRYNRHSACLLARSAMYASSGKVSRLSLILKNFFTAGYARLQRGGLGSRAFGKDLLNLWFCK